jgi:hypothetical protein
VVFELDLDGIRVSCSSPVWTQKLIDRGGRLVRKGQVEELRQALGTGGTDAARRVPAADRHIPSAR